MGKRSTSSYSYQHELGTNNEDILDDNNGNAEPLMTSDQQFMKENSLYNPLKYDLTCDSDLLLKCKSTASNDQESRLLNPMDVRTYDSLHSTSMKSEIFNKTPTSSSANAFNLEETVIATSTKGKVSTSHKFEKVNSEPTDCFSNRPFDGIAVLHLNDQTLMFSTIKLSSRPDNQQSFFMRHDSSPFRTLSIEEKKTKTVEIVTSPVAEKINLQKSMSKDPEENTLNDCCSLLSNSSTDNRSPALLVKKADRFSYSSLSDSESEQLSEYRKTIYSNTASISTADEPPSKKYRVDSDQELGGDRMSESPDVRAPSANSEISTYSEQSFDVSSETKQELNTTGYNKIIMCLSTLSKEVTNPQIEVNDVIKLINKSTATMIDKKNREPVNKRHPSTVLFNVTWEKREQLEITLRPFIVKCFPSKYESDVESDVSSEVANLYKDDHRSKYYPTINGDKFHDLLKIMWPLTTYSDFRNVKKFVELDPAERAIYVLAVLIYQRNGTAKKLGLDESQMIFAFTVELAKRGVLGSFDNMENRIRNSEKLLKLNSKKSPSNASLVKLRRALRASKLSIGLACLRWLFRFVTDSKREPGPETDEYSFSENWNELIKEHEKLRREEMSRELDCIEQELKRRNNWNNQQKNALDAYKTANSFISPLKNVSCLLVDFKSYTYDKILKASPNQGDSQRSSSSQETQSYHKSIREPLIKTFPGTSLRLMTYEELNDWAEHQPLPYNLDELECHHQQQ